MKAFSSGRKAKEFVISKIVVEAQRENVILSEVSEMPSAASRRRITTFP